VDEAVEYLRAAAAAGTERMAATPPRGARERVGAPERMWEVREALGEEGIEVDVDCGGEL
jgi:hypothetical protein